MCARCLLARRFGWKKTVPTYCVRPYCARLYAHCGWFFLAFWPAFGYHTMIQELGLLEKNAFFFGWAMAEFYYKRWLPFIVNKRRILILAIASYIAMC